MIASDRPTCFPENVIVGCSSIDDGSMLNRAVGAHAPDAVANRMKFCEKLGIDYANTVFQYIVYGDKRAYDLICEVDDGATTKYSTEMVADALVTRATGVALFLPVADCIATVLYDPGTQTLALLHLGRHSTVAELLGRVIRKMVNEGADAAEIVVWMSPSAQMSHYVMEWFDRADEPAWRDFCREKADGYHLDLQGFNQRACLDNGLAPENIHISPINTVTDPNYFSHSAGDVSGRVGVVAMMR